MQTAVPMEVLFRERGFTTEPSLGPRQSMLSVGPLGRGLALLRRQKIEAATKAHAQLEEAYDCCCLCPPRRPSTGIQLA
jgi:hypothetical protein